MLTPQVSRPHAVSTRLARVAAALLAALLLLGASVLTAPAAHAATVHQGGMTFETDDATLTATVTAYDNSANFVFIPGTITDGVATYTVTTIGDRAFYDTDIEFVFVGNSVTTIGEYAFASTNLTYVPLPGSVTTIGDFAFAYAPLTTVNIGNSVTTIGNSAFAETKLTAVTIPGSVTTIGDSAFHSTTLSSVTIPASVTTIGPAAFPITVTAAVFRGAPPVGFSPLGPSGSFENNPSVVMYYPSAYAASYDPGSTGVWQGYATAPGATLSYDLGGHGSAISDVTVAPGTAVASPRAPTATGYTFRGWFTTSAGSTPFDFTAPLTADTTAFAHWTAVLAPVTQGGMTFEIDDATLTATVTDYNNSATTLVIPGTITPNSIEYTVTAIGDGAFHNNGLTTVTIPDTVTTIGNSAFAFTDLTTVTIPDTVTTIGNSAFYNTGLTTVTIGNSVTIIDGFAFALTGLTTVTIPDTVTTIGEGAFYDVPLSAVTIPDSVTTIGGVAFSGTGLTTVSIPDSVTTIGNDAFAPALTSAVFQGAPPVGFFPFGFPGSLGDNPSVVVYYPSAFAADYAPGGITTWQGYATAPGATLSYDLGGHGSAISDVTVAPGTAVASPPAPTATGYTFDGWFTARTGGAAFNFGAALATDTTAFARWTAISAPAASPTLPIMGFDSTPLMMTGTLLLVLGASALILTRTRRHRRAPGTTE